MLFVSFRETLSEMSEKVGLQMIAEKNFGKDINAALDETDKWHKRKRIFTASLAIMIVFLFVLFRSRSILNIRNLLLQNLRAFNDRISLNAVTPEALCHARARLGVEPLRIFFERIKPAWTFEGFTIYAVDGSSFNVPDTPANEDEFGRPDNSAYPRMEVEASTRQIRAVIFMPCDKSEREAVLEMLPRLGKKDLVLMDMGISSTWVFYQCRKNSAHFVARIPKGWKPRIVKELGVGDNIVEMRGCASKELRRAKASFKLKMRMIEYKIDDGETIRLPADLLAPLQYPARKIAELYHSRWECEMAYDELKNHISSTASGAQNLLFRSKTPDGILQEAYALCALYNTVRGVMAEAGKAYDMPPLDISFVATAYVFRDVIPRLVYAKTDSERSFILNQMLKDVAESVNPRSRHNRQYPRNTKVKTNKYAARKEDYCGKKTNFSQRLRLVG